MPGAVAAGHRLTAEAGAEILRAGGGAADAAVAALAMACVCEPVLCSLGGGGLAMLRPPDGHARLVDFFPQTPITRRPDAAPPDDVDADFGPATQSFRIGASTAATPGMVPGLVHLNERYGTLPLDVVLAPAIAAARDGVDVTPFQHHLATVVAPILVATPAARDLFAPDGVPMDTGRRFVNDGVARALELIAGGDWSEIEQAVLAAQAPGDDGGGHLTSDDLAAYEVVERSPDQRAIGGSTVLLPPLPAAGGVLVGHTLARMRGPDPVSAADAIAATGRARVAADGDLSLLADAPIRRRGTTHVSVVTADGSACAVTVTNGEGNGAIVDGFGFMLNNVLGETDVNPYGTDRWPPDTRLATMMCPTLLDSPGVGVTALGSGGSNRIRSAIAQVVAHLAAGADLGAAVHAPRVHVEQRGETGHLDVEDPGDAVVLAELVERFPDHRVWPEPSLFFGGVHAARRAGDGSFRAVGDPRRNGAVAIVD